MVTCIEQSFDVYYIQSVCNKSVDIMQQKITTLLFLLKYSFVETPRNFIIAELSIRKLGSSLALMKIRAYGSKALR